jgi:hypothetical protein
MEEKGLLFFKYTDIDIILKKLKWDEKPIEEKKCIVCGTPVTKENIGAFVPGSYKPVCNKFSCLMAILLKERKEMLAR